MFWSAAKKLRWKRGVTCQLACEDIENFYSGIYPPRSTPNIVHSNARHFELDAEMDYTEITNAIKNLAHSKSPGPDEITNSYKRLPVKGILYL